MPIKNKEQRNQYIKEWKERKRRSLGIPPKGSTPLEIKQERIKQSRQKYLEKNKEKVRSNKQNYLDNNPAKRLLWAAKKRAKEQNLPFNIEESDIIIPTKCPYLDIELVTSSRRGDSRENVLSLDKIIPELGYVKGNVEVISHLANTMKSNATEEQLIAFATEILKRYSTKTTNKSCSL